MYKYIVDAEARIVFQIPSEPMVIEQKDRRGKTRGWSVNVDIIIIRADNTLNGNRWQHGTSSYWNQSFDARYTQDNFVSYFLMRPAPNGESIPRKQYLELQSQYEVIVLGQPDEYVRKSAER